MMYKANISATVLTRHDEHEFGDAIPTRKSLEMRQDVHQPTFDGEVQTGVTIIPFHAVNAAAFAYSTSNTPDPVDANCVENESGGCETLYDGNVTFYYNESAGRMAGMFNMTGAFTPGATVNVTLAEATASGTLEYSGGQLGAELSIDGNVVGVIFTADGVTTILMPGGPGEPVTIPVKVEQCGAPECHVLFEGEVTFVDYEADFTLSEPLVEGGAITATLNGEEMNGIVQVDGYNAGCRLEKDGEDVAAINAVGLNATIEVSSIEEGSASLKIEQCSHGGGGCDISVNPNPIEINWGEGAPPQTVNVGVTGANVTYEIGDQTIISVSGSVPNYAVTGIAYGDTTLTFSNENCTVVVPVSVISIK